MKPPPSYILETSLQVRLTATENVELEADAFMARFHKWLRRQGVEFRLHAGISEVPDEDHPPPSQEMVDALMEKLHVLQKEALGLARMKMIDADPPILTLAKADQNLH